MFQRFPVQDVDEFVPSEYPELVESLRRMVAQPDHWPPGPQVDMLLSYVRFHSIRSQLVKDHPDAARLITSGSLPLDVMEALFESARQNPLFSEQLEEYIRKCLHTAPAS